MFGIAPSGQLERRERLSGLIHNFMTFLFFIIIVLLIGSSRMFSVGIRNDNLYLVFPHWLVVYKVILNINLILMRLVTIHHWLLSE